jgi:hypothetical protein
MENHARAIANGTIAACMLLPRQPFSDPVMAGVHQQMYEAERSRAKTEALAGQADAPLRTTARWF